MPPTSASRVLSGSRQRWQAAISPRDATSTMKCHAPRGSSRTSATRSRRNETHAAQRPRPTPPPRLYHAPGRQLSRPWTIRWRNEQWCRDAPCAPRQTNVPGPLGPGTETPERERDGPQAALNSDSAATTSSVSSVRRPRALFDSTSVMRCTAPRSSSRSTAAISRAIRSSALS